MSILSHQSAVNANSSFWVPTGQGGGGGGGSNFTTINVTTQIQAATADCALGDTGVANLFTDFQAQGDAWQLFYAPIGTPSSCAISVTGDSGGSGGGIRMGVDVSNGPNKEIAFMNGYYNVVGASGQSGLIQDFASYSFQAGGTDYFQIQPGQVATNNGAIFLANSVYVSSIKDGGGNYTANTEALLSTLASVYPACFS